MKIPSYKSTDTVRLFNLGDLHRGSDAFDHSLFNKVIDEIGSDDQAYWVSTGDLFEVGLVGSLSGSYQKLNLSDEYYALAEELRPIAGKCLGIVGSNHHARFERATSMSLDRLFCGELGIKDKWLGDYGVIRIKAGHAPYYIVMHHGVGGGRKRGGKVNNLQELGNIFSGADVYMEGHCHGFSYFPDKMCYIDKKRGNWIEYDAHFVCTAHFLDYFKSYGASKKYKPSSMGSAVVTLHARDSGNMNRKKVNAELFN